MKLRTLLFIFGLVFVLVLTGCGGGGTASEEEAGGGSGEVETPTIRIAADVIPHAEILEFIKPTLAEQGVNIEIITGVEQQNEAVRDNQADANYFQHVPYLESVAEELNFDYAVLVNVHVEPIGFYSEKYDSADKLPDGASILITNDPSNEYRMLVLLEKQGLIKLRDNIIDYQATPKDIVENPKNFEFIEVEPGLLARNLPEVDGAIINTNRVLEAGIDPKAALFREDADSPYGNVVVVRKGDENKPEFQKLKDALLSPEVKQFIEDKYGVAVVPAF